MSKSSFSYFSLFNSILFLILTFASVYFVFKFLAFLNSLIKLLNTNSESLQSLLTQIQKELDYAHPLQEQITKALENIANFKVSLF